MFAVNATPERRAPALHVSADTAEKNTSPVLSESEGSLAAHPSSHSKSSYASVSPAKARAASLHTRTTFARTNLANSSHTSPTALHDTTPSLPITRAELEKATDAFTTSLPVSSSSPVRSILDFYLGTSPSPRRPDRVDRASSPAATPQRSSDDADFHRSPAPARTYLDDFLAASDSSADHRETTWHSPPGPTSPLPSSHRASRVVGVAMDKSPVIREMWAETSSSSSESEKESLASNRSPQRAAFQSPPPAAVQKVAEAKGQFSGQQPQQPSVERTLIYPTAQVDSADINVALHERFAAEKQTGSPPPPHRALATVGQLTPSTGKKGIKAGVAEATPIVHEDASPLSNSAETFRDQSNASGRPSQRVFTALTSLLRMQSTHNTNTAVQEMREVPMRSSAPSRAAATTAPLWKSPHRGSAFADADNSFAVTQEEDVGGKEANGVSYFHRLVRRTPLSPPSYVDPHRNVASAVIASTQPLLPRRRRARSVVARLYPTPSSTATASSLTNGVSNASRSNSTSRAHRWNASTKIQYDPLTASMETMAPTAQVENAQSRSHSGVEDYVRERPSSLPVRRSGSSPPPPPSAAPLHTRTTLLRLAAMAARKAEEDAKREEEEHPSFHPQVAPHSARICRAKLRELAANPIAASESVRAGETEKKAAVVERPKAETDTPARHAAHRTKQTVLTPAAKNSVKSVTDRLYEEAAQLRARQQERRDEHERNVLAREQAEKMALSAKACNRTHSNNGKVEGEQTKAADTEKTVEKSSTGDESATVAAEQWSGAASVLQPSFARHETPPRERLVPRVDLYSSAEPTEVTETGKDEASHRRQNVEDRLLALEESRRQRMYVMRQLADTRDAATAQRLFKPFTGR